MDGTAADLPGQYRRGKLRLDYQRQLLEYKKMSHADLMHHFDVGHQRDLDLARALERRRQIDEAHRPRHSIGARARNAFGRMLIAAGERIRPETVAGERALNA
jgi:hypothetical protein